MKRVKIIGAGIAGCEAALQLSSNGYIVDIIDNKNCENNIYPISSISSNIWDIY